MKRYNIAIYILGILLFACGCSKTTEQAIPYSKLSMYGFFKDMKKQIPAANVYPYDLNTPLFSDYTSKRRFIFLPSGTTMSYHDEDAFTFPHGTILVKTFSMPFALNALNKGEKLLETRLLINDSGTWKAYPYIWNATETEAVLELVGDTISVSWTHTDEQQHTNAYVVPNVNDCKSCHSKNNQVVPIGPKAKNLNMNIVVDNGKTQNQISHWQNLQILTNVPNQNIPQLADWDDETSGSIAVRTRAYLDVNCAHCHSPYGPANNAGLDFRSEHHDLEKLGVYKAPVAAGHGTGGRDYDIVPGKPDKSIIVYRMQSIEPKVAMPEFGRGLVHAEGVLLVSEWIKQMTSQEGD